MKNNRTSFSKGKKDDVNVSGIYVDMEIIRCGKNSGDEKAESKKVL